MTSVAPEQKLIRGGRDCVRRGEIIRDLGEKRERMRAVFSGICRNEPIEYYVMRYKSVQMRFEQEQNAN